jgi:hypothetical protein
MDIRGALSKLDPANDEQWTDDGLPRTGALEALGLKGVTRGKITAAAPGFTRFNTGLDPDGDDAPEGAPPELPPTETNLNMESSEFGGSSPEGAESAPPSPPPAPLDPDAAKKALALADEAVAKAQKAATAAKAAEAAAQALRDEALTRLERERTPNEKQSILMGYLQSVAPSKEPAVQAKQEMSPLDKAHTKQLGYGKGRPNYPTR